MKGCNKCGGLVKPGYDCELCDAGFCGDCVYIKKVTIQFKILQKQTKSNLFFSGWQPAQGGLQTVRRRLIVIPTKLLIVIVDCDLHTIGLLQHELLQPTQCTCDPGKRKSASDPIQIVYCHRPTQLIIIRQPNPKYATTVTCPHVIKPIS